MGEQRQFYVYIWCRSDGSPMYVGKGCNGRAFEQSGHRLKVPKDKECIIIQNYDSEADAFEAEKFFIALWGRKDNSTYGLLRNLTDGGEGASGHVWNPSPEQYRNTVLAQRAFWTAAKCHEHRRKAWLRILETGKKLNGKPLSLKARLTITRELNRQHSLRWDHEKACRLLDKTLRDEPETPFSWLVSLLEERFDLSRSEAEDSVAGYLCGDDGFNDDPNFARIEWQFRIQALYRAEGYVPEEMGDLVDEKIASVELDEEVEPDVVDQPPATIDEMFGLMPVEPAPAFAAAA